MANLAISQKLARIWKIQKQRYRLKGPTNTLIGVVLLFFMFWVGWVAGKAVWPQQIINKNAFVAWGSVIIHTLFQLIGVLYCLPGYFKLGWFSYYDKYQVNKKSLWPWERPNWKEMRTKTLWNILINQFLIYPIPCYLSTVIGIELRFDDLPSYWELFLQINFIFFLEDCFFYWGHRFCHTVKAFYVYHKVHHEYDHLFTPASQYLHPLDYAIANILPSAFCFIILGNRVHAFTFLFWIVHKILFSGQNHCGYQFPWSPFRVVPFVAEVSYHDDHHSVNVGNFAGSWYIWDVLYDTEGPYNDQFLKIGQKTE